MPHVLRVMLASMALAGVMAVMLPIGAAQALNCNAAGPRCAVQAGGWCDRNKGWEVPPAGRDAYNRCYEAAINRANRRIDAAFAKHGNFSHVPAGTACVSPTVNYRFSGE